MWFAWLRRRRRRGQRIAVYAELCTADDERRAGITHDPEHEARIAELRAEVDKWRTSLRRGGYTR